MDLPLSQQCSENGKETSERVIGLSRNTAPSDHDTTLSEEPVPMPLQPFGLQYLCQRLSCTREEFHGQYHDSRKLLGNNVEDAHKSWHKLAASASIHPVKKAIALSFSVLSIAEHAAFLQQHWDDLWRQIDHDTPDYNMVRFMIQYTLAWAIQFQDLGKALTKVKACYKDMQKLNPDNFFLAPYYTVTIGRWIYEIHARNLSYGVIAEVLVYVDETLQLIGTLEDDWARIDAFGAKLSALRLLILIEEYYHRYSLYITDTHRNLRLRIKNLYTEISEELSQNSSRIVLYDKAWFHSVSATYYQAASNTATTPDEKERLYSLAQCSIAQAARLYDRNGRWWRSRDEAKRSDNPDIIRAYSKQLQSASCI